MMSPTEFTPLEIDVATKAGALLREQFSKTTQARYLANTCESCGAFCGDFYLHDFWNAEPVAPPIEAVLGCLECFTAVARTPDADGSIWIGEIPHEVEDSDEADDDFTSPPSAAVKEAPPQTKRAPASPPKLPTIWGHCGECGASACPATISDGRFFCSQCGGIRPFVPSVP